MGWMSASGRDTVASEDEAMAEDVRAPSAGVTSVDDEATSVSGLQDDEDDDGASWPEEEEALSLDSVGSHSSEDELETINAAQNADNNVDDEEEQIVSQQLRRKRSRPGSSFSSDDDDEVSDILLSAEGVDVDEDSTSCPAPGDDAAVAPVQFSATPPQDLPRPGRVLAAAPEPGKPPSSSSSSGSRPPPPKTLHFNDGAAVLSRRATLTSSTSECIGFHRPNTASSTPATPRQASSDSRPMHAARQPRPFLDFDKMRQKAAHALTSWKHGSELTLACR